MLTVGKNAGHGGEVEGGGPVGVALASEEGDGRSADTIAIHAVH